ncbi:transcription factor E2F3-like [Synchiropus picturatus]
MEANNPDRAEDEAMNPQPGCSSAVVRPRRKPSAHMTPKRGQNKLMSLTQRFMGLVHQSPDGVVDVHSMAKALNAPVRRVYDITNVLEGVQLIEKKEKKQMQVIPSLRHKSLDEEILKLAEEEALLDKMIPLYQNKTQQMLLDPETSKYP